MQHFFVFRNKTHFSVDQDVIGIFNGNANFFMFFEILELYSIIYFVFLPYKPSVVPSLRVSTTSR